MPQSELSMALHTRPFQMAGARFAMQHKNVLIADEPGLGKTIQSIAAVIGSKTNGSVLVVAPKTAVYVTWPFELRRWLADVAPDDVVRIIGGNATRPERLQQVRDVLKWHLQFSPWPSDSKPVRQWVLLSPNYLRFKIEVDDDNHFIYGPDGKKIITPVREAIPQLLKIPWAAVIVDEAHQTLAGATGNIKKQSAQSRGLRLLEIQEDGMRLALSGTPFRGKHENLWGIANWLLPAEYTGYWPWIKKHFETFHDDVFNTDVIGELRSEEKLARETRRFMIRRTKRQVLPEMPDKFYGGTPLWPEKKPPLALLEAQDRAAAEMRRELKANPKNTLARVPYQKATDKVTEWYHQNNPIAVWLPMDGPQRKAYKQMEKEAMADIDGGTLMANHFFAISTRLKQFANSYGFIDPKDDFQPQLPSNKFDWLLQFLSERGIDGPDPSGNRVVVASQFTRHLKLFAAELKEHYKINSFLLTGEVTDGKVRERMQQAFQSGVTPKGNPSAEVFLLNTHAGGVSLTLDAADDVVIIDSTKNPDDQTQVEDRCHRISRIHNVTVWNLCSLDTVDEGILRDTREQGMSLERVLKQGGAAAAKRMLGAA